MSSPAPHNAATFPYRHFPPDTFSYWWSGIPVGIGRNGSPTTTGAEHAVLVVGPPRVGKTSTVIIPAILSAPGPVVTTSTKPDVMEATASWRSHGCGGGHGGVCFLFDPSASVSVPEGVTPLRWSPVVGCESFETANAMASALASATRPGAQFTEAAHWIERASALLAPLLHAAALDGKTIAEVFDWVSTHDVRHAEAVLAAQRSNRAKVVLAGIWGTEERERSGIFSTAAGLLAAYRSEAALQAACRPNFDPDHFATSYDTVYVVAPAADQERLAPLVVALIEQIRNAVYRFRASNPDSVPTVFALDEVANIAPLPSLPQLASEGASQGALTVASIQDLSQARARWGAVAEGFFTLFSTKVIFPGIGDARTLELISQLAGEEQIPVKSISAPGTFLSALASNGGTQVHWSTQWRRKIPVDQVARGRPGCALLIAPGSIISTVWSVPWFAYPEWYEQATGQTWPGDRDSWRQQGSQ